MMNLNNLNIKYYLLVFNQKNKIRERRKPHKRFLLGNLLFETVADILVCQKIEIDIYFVHFSWVFFCKRKKKY